MPSIYVPGTPNPYFPKHKYHGVPVLGSYYPVQEAKLHHYVGPGAQLKKGVAAYVLTPEHLWATFQKEAEDIIKVNGKLIEDDRERNKRINAAYAKLWLADDRFQWAGLAAFASKQVGCGLLHAAQLSERNKDELRYAAHLASNNNEPDMQSALAKNQFAWAIGFPSGVYMEIQLTLSAQCKAKAGLTAFFPRPKDAKLWVVDERMKFVYRAADRFDELLKGKERPYVEESLRRISAGGGVE